MSTREDYGNAYVCQDCYFAHHYGAHEHEGMWYSGDSDTPAECEPLARLAGYELSDNTCSNHSVTDLRDSDGDETGETSECEYCGQSGYETGEHDFSWRACEGCGSHLGGSRHRLAVWH